VLSGTAIEEIEKCPARWFLERQVRAEAVKESPLVFGNALHKIAEGLASQSIEPNIEHIDALLDRMWPGMSYDAVWESKMQRSAAHDASVRLLAWFLEHSRFEAHVEARLSASIDVPHPHNAQETVTVGLKGYADRFEFTADGVVVYDYKTGRKAMENSELVKNIQLALYEYMLQKGTYDTAEHSGNRLPEGVNVSAAALVHLRLDSPDEPGLPRVQQVAAGTHDTKGELLEQRIAHAAHVVIGGRYETRYDPNTCGRCAVRFMCPASPEGGAVL
jgi:RecB family exonuclease